MRTFGVVQQTPKVFHVATPDTFRVEKPGRYRVDLDSFKSAQTGSMTLPLVVLIGLMVVGLLLSTRLKEAPTLTR
jgi:hypothetical protein